MLDHHIIFIQIFIIISIFIIIYSIISFLEGKDKIRDNNNKNSDWIVFTLFILIGVSIGVLYVAKLLKEANDISLIWLVGIILKVVCAQIVSNIAKNQGRNSTLWWFLGFFEYHSALLVLACSDKLLKVKKNKIEIFKDINDEYNNNLKSLNDLYSNKILTKKELEIKIEKLNSEFSQKENEINKKQNSKKVEVEESEFLSKLEEAYKTGILTTEEYNNKLEKYYFKITENKNGS